MRNFTTLSKATGLPSLLLLVVFALVGALPAAGQVTTDASDPNDNGEAETETIWLTINAPKTQAWSKSEIKLDGLITESEPSNDNIDYSKLQLILTVTPTFETKNAPWGKDFTETWESSWGINEPQWNQIQAIHNIDPDAPIDAYYSAPEISKLVDEKYLSTNSPSILFGCSGRYKLTISSEKSNVTFAKATEYIDIYPSTTLTYQMKDDKGNYYTDRLSINNFLVSENNTELNYGKEYVSELSHVGLVIPGTYLAEVYYRVGGLTTSDPTEDHLPDSEEQENLSQFKAPSKADSNNVTIPDGYVKAMKGNFLNLSQLSDTNSTIDLSLLLVKNGAATPMINNTNQTESTLHVYLKPTTETGVETIGVEEDGDEIYFDLNGFRVNPDNLQHGIYIVRKGNSTHKVII